MKKAARLLEEPMTEAEWREGANPAKMVTHLRKQKASQRKLRLFGCACCRRVWARLGEASRQAVEVAERFADGLAQRKDLSAALRACGEAGHDPAAMVVKVSLEMAAFWASYNARVQAAGTGPIQASQMAAHSAAMNAEGLAQGKLLHDLFTPSRPNVLAPAWLTTAVEQLAQAAYGERQLPSGELDPGRLAVLADALEEAGCTDVEILTHLRGPGPHVRGCFAVDLCLGLS